MLLTFLLLSDGAAFQEEGAAEHRTSLLPPLIALERASRQSPMSLCTRGWCCWAAGRAALPKGWDAVNAILAIWKQIHQVGAGHIVYAVLELKRLPAPLPAPRGCVRAQKTSNPLDVGWFPAPPQKQRFSSYTLPQFIMDSLARQDLPFSASGLTSGQKVLNWLSVFFLYHQLPYLHDCTTEGPSSYYLT